MKFWDRLALDIAKAIVPDGYEVRQTGIGAQLLTAAMLQEERERASRLKFRPDSSRSPEGGER